MISAISWVPKGVSKSEPIVADPPPEEEIQELIANHKNASDDSDNDDANDEVVAQALTVANAVGKASIGNTDDITIALKDLNMDNYDDEEEGVELFSSGIGDLYYPSNDMDPYLKDKNDDDSDDLEDMVINPTDSIIVYAYNEDDVSHIEVCVLEDAHSNERNMYSHHTILIPAFPLCTAWLDCPLKGGERGNFIAVGSMEPSIEIWDLDVIDAVQPCVVLGGLEEKKKKGKKKSIRYKKDSHTDSVLGLAWNKEYRNILASASADKNVKIWDVVTGKCEYTLDHHEDKVQAVAWNHHAPQVLLSGSFDHTVALRDARMPKHSGYSWEVSTDVESLAWDPHTEHSFVVSLDDGIVKGFDIRKAKSDGFDIRKAKSDSSQPDPSLTFTLHAHDKAVSSVSYNPSAPNLLATGSMDKTVKLWDLSNNQPSFVASNSPKAGAIFKISFSEDDPFLLAIGGSKGKLQLWDTLSDSGVARRYGSYNKNRSPSGS
ncbi:uncharacterized WD repeat-containing protein C17D11.16 isoform X2 [Vigna radiata var. radiata]|uniref:Uncharacterized WD repeat-containing protein C17D11.16 isoform X2 n=1 Tax=Vigna radiata var. radiata TaxID=3916 RepID=A0A1S3U9E3_VIGRR|nr:uncharacterized WD repeat-containing protein C17D11.16 isoform X2 [Vigna radiata var. radiata]